MAYLDQDTGERRSVTLNVVGHASGDIFLLKNQAKEVRNGDSGIQALGGSVAMALPRQILSMLHLGVGSQVDVIVWRTAG